MTVLELKNYLEMLCYDGKHQSMVLFAEKAFDSELKRVVAFSHGIDTVTLTSDGAHIPGLPIGPTMAAARTLPRSPEAA